MVIFVKICCLIRKVLGETNGEIDVNSGTARQAMYQHADKSLARPGRKQTRKHVRDARDFNKIETLAVINLFFSCEERRRRKFTPF